jgi:hypothetical protein
MLLKMPVLNLAMVQSQKQNASRISHTYKNNVFFSKCQQAIKTEKVI